MTPLSELLREYFGQRGHTILEPKLKEAESRRTIFVTIKNIKDEKEYLRDQCRVFYMEKEHLNLKIDSLKKVILKK